MSTTDTGGITGRRYVPSDFFSSADHAAFDGICAAAGASTCSGRLGVLRCIAPRGHRDGCVYRSGSGSEVPDRHDQDGHWWSVAAAMMTNRVYNHREGD